MATQLAAAQAGADIIDCCIDSMSGGSLPCRKRDQISAKFLCNFIFTLSMLYLYFRCALTLSASTFGPQLGLCMLCVFICLFADGVVAAWHYRRVSFCSDCFCLVTGREHVRPSRGCVWSVTSQTCQRGCSKNCHEPGAGEYLRTSGA